VIERKASKNIVILIMIFRLTINFQYLYYWWKI